MSASETLRKANFFLVGAPKAGTTSIEAFLRGRPEVFLSPIKEPTHFCTDINAEIATDFLAREAVIEIGEYLAQPKLARVHLHFVLDPKDYARLFAGAGNASVVGECSTKYLSSRNAAANIRAYNPDAKVVAVLRHPVERIRSHYLMDRKIGIVTRDLGWYLEEELALGDAASWRNCRYYLGATRYAEQVARWQAVFPPDRFLVLVLEEIVADPDAEMAKLLAFLGLAPALGPVVLARENAAQHARFGGLNRVLYRTGVRRLAARWLPRILPRRTWEAVRSAWYRSASGSDDGANSVVMARFLHETRSATEKLLGRGLPQWT